jgi:hypothetical protein
MKEVGKDQLTQTEVVLLVVTTGLRLPATMDYHDAWWTNQQGRGNLVGKLQARWEIGISVRGGPRDATPQPAAPRSAQPQTWHD